MILKGNQRGGGQNLATHLLNEFTNDRVEVLDTRGSVAQDLHGAFAEWHAQSKATQGKKYLFSLSVNPDEKQRRLTHEEYFDLAERAGKKLGLAEQPRAIVMHEKKDEQGIKRQHIHIVWSRTDAEKSKFVHMSEYKLKLRAVAKEFARDHGLDVPRGMKNDGLTDRFARQAQTANLAENQQEERSGLSKENRRGEITGLWEATATGREFVAALARNDYYLARGDSGKFVVVDLAGDIHSLPRQIPGLRKKDIEARLGPEFALDKLQGVERAKAYAKEVRDFRRRQLTIMRDPALPTPEEQRADLRRQHAARRAALDGERDKLFLRQAREKGQLAILQASENAGIAAQRTGKKPSGITAFVMRITGITLIADLRQRSQDAVRAREHAQQVEALQRRQDREQQESTRHYRALERVERREFRSLEIAMRREEFQKTAERGGKSRPPDKQGPALTPPEPMRVVPPRGPQPKQPDGKRLVGPFTRAASGKPKAEKPEQQKPLTLRDTFTRASLETEPDITPAITPEPVTDNTTSEPPATSLADEFRRRAEKKDRGRDDPESGDRGREKHYRAARIDPTVRR